ncbi:hypothetical protein ACQ4M3_41425 [Leptolyngbya sp. AN03gr2]|uniref:hypothetical protein n=1 Tax=unclassified Leptolyngbya TaxID=2650499 RepID=UPI003D30F1F1
MTLSLDLEGYQALRQSHQAQIDRLLFLGLRRSLAHAYARQVQLKSLMEARV